MRRLKLRKRQKFDKFNVLIIVIILLIISIFFALRFINSKVSPILLKYAETEIANFANIIINKAITKQITSEMNLDNLFSITKNDSGEIQTIDFNPAIVNTVLNATANLVQLNLKAVEEGNIDMIELSDEILVEYDKDNLKKGIVYEIPLGSITNSSLLSNLGPKIPVKIKLVGSVYSNISTKVSQYGINNALVEVYINIQVTERVILPFSTKEITVENNIPIIMKIIEGKIPSYYFNSGLSQNSSILTIPIE